jgi:hypothetical protein
MPDVSTLTDEELTNLRLEVLNEIERRQRISAAPQQAEVLSRRYLVDTGKVAGTAWSQPAGAHDAYPIGWVVSHNNKTWESTTPANVWEPGVSGWREIVEEGEAPADWVQPTGAHDAYSEGDLVTYGGQVWQSTAPANVWEPGVYGWVVVAA